jgi:hypothetical protein
MGFGAYGQKATFASVQIGDENGLPDSSPTTNSRLDITLPALPMDRPPSGIEVELAGGKKLRFDRDVDPETVRRMIATLEGRSQ